VHVQRVSESIMSKWSVVLLCTELAWIGSGVLATLGAQRKGYQNAQKAGCGNFRINESSQVSRQRPAVCSAMISMRFIARRVAPF
jgi:hypothetical protein